MTEGRASDVQILNIDFQHTINTFLLGAACLAAMAACMPPRPKFTLRQGRINRWVFPSNRWVYPVSQVGAALSHEWDAKMYYCPG